MYPLSRDYQVLSMNQFTAFFVYTLLDLLNRERSWFQELVST
jgi:hypothetical protein